MVEGHSAEDLIQKVNYTLEVDVLRDVGDVSSCCAVRGIPKTSGFRRAVARLPPQVEEVVGMSARALWATAPGGCPARLVVTRRRLADAGRRPVSLEPTGGSETGRVCDGIR